MIPAGFTFKTLLFSISSVEPSTYVTTSLEGSVVDTATVSISEVGLVTSVPFRLSNRASLLFLEYSNFSLDLIVVRSVVVILLISLTVIRLSSVKSLISYLYVWDLTTKLKAPGAFRLLPPDSLLPLESSSCRYLAPNTAYWSSVFV